MRFVFQISFALVIFFLVSIGVIRTRPYGDELRDSLNMPSGDCDMPCWAGIHPGMASDAATNILRHHPWVDRVWGVSFIHWTWNGQQPGWIDGSHPGIVSTHYGAVDQIGIPTTLSIGDLWLMFDHLDRGVIFASGSSGLVYNFANVENGLFWVKADLNCPIHIEQFWHAPGLILIGGMSTFERFHVGDFDDYTSPGWFANVSC